MQQSISALALGWHPPAVHKTLFSSAHALIRRMQRVTPSTQSYGCHGRGDANLSEGNGCSRKEESDHMTVSPPAKGGTGVILNCSWVKPQRTAHWEQTDGESRGPGNSFSIPQPVVLHGSRAPYESSKSHTTAAWATLGSESQRDESRS